ncbi:MAG: tRNA lysidine(34) synthetase TilS [Firmicutes bacterium]|nr:tRNA lysidine(34) synthetase TilS [Bacillota bacterium]
MLKAEKIIRETIREHNLIENGDHIVIGLSGGPDSVCLFHVLSVMAEDMDLTIYPVHVNHQFRPGAAEADQKYVEDLCDRFGLTANVFTVNCNALAAELGMTSEEAGRKVRYDAFFLMAEKIAEDLGGAARVKIAVGHNANDQAETVLFRILRGTGMDGLAGMAYSRDESRGDGEDTGTYRVVRPLLDVWREDVEAYCEAKGLDPVTDHTNNEELYVRNRIRLDLIPYIEEKYNTNFQEGLVRMAKIAAADKDYFWKETARAYEKLEVTSSSADDSIDGQGAGGLADANIVALNWRGLAECHEALRHRVILKAFGEIGLDKDITAERLEAADKIILGNVGGKTVEFPHGYSLSAGKGLIILKRNL